MKKLREQIKRLYLKAPTWVSLALSICVLTAACVIFLLLLRSREYDAEKMRRQTQARNASAEAHAKLAANEVEILFADVKVALERTLKTVPIEAGHLFLEQWRELNPFVASALLVNEQGMLEAGKDWPKEMADDYREALKSKEAVAAQKKLSPAFVNRLRETPWHVGAAPEKSPPQSAAPAEQPAWQTLRKDVRETAEKDPFSTPSGAEFLPKTAAGSTSNSLPSNNYTREETWRERRLRLGIPFPERTGWDSTPSDSATPPAIFIWRQCDDDIVLAVEVDLPKLAKKLAETLPVETVSNGVFRLLTDGNSAASSTAAAGDFVRDVPIVSDLLHKWAVRVVRKTSADEIPSQTPFYLSLFLLFLATSASIALIYFFRMWIVESEKRVRITNHFSHEIRNLLQKMGNLVDLAPSAGNCISIKEHEKIGKMILNGRRIYRAAVCMLDFFSALAKGRKIRTELFDVAQTVKELLEELKSNLKGEDGEVLELFSEIPEHEIEIKSNVSIVESILQNLLKNVCKYAMDGKKLNVSLKENVAAGTVLLCVRDYGPGISPKNQKNIFEAFRRLDEQKDGYGLGLTLSREFARALGGDLTCETPTDATHGTLFTLQLPKAHSEK
ncbi:MAG: HAMP domain-containing histidine kinase [Puniceicoccales bacterium]|jgi:signal transduction histidine kinase|nr:HAMP domain-containing histidine kinase [Puniceicoccales bacterium]